MWYTTANSDINIRLLHNILLEIYTLYSYFINYTITNDGTRHTAHLKKILLFSKLLDSNKPNPGRVINLK